MPGELVLPLERGLCNPVFSSSVSSQDAQHPPVSHLRYFVIMRILRQIDIQSSLKYNVGAKKGPVAQLGARINRTDEVAGSNPARSIPVDEGALTE